jgi:preflagellin peptidase FlaK
MLYAAIALVGLGIATYTDLRDRTIPNQLTYAMLFIGLLGHLVETFLSASLAPVLFSAAGAVIAFAFAYILWRAGAWAGGDVKLFAALGALVPLPYTLVPQFYFQYPVFPFLVLMNSVLIAFPFIMLYVFTKTVVDKRLHKHAEKMLFDVSERTAALSLWLFGCYSLLSAVGLPSWLSVVLVLPLPFVPYKHLAALALAIAGALLTRDIAPIVPLAFVSLVFLSFVEAAGYGVKHVLRRRVPLAQSEGEISAETLYVEKGKVKVFDSSLLKMLLSGFTTPKRTLVSEYNAAGIEPEDIKALKRRGVKNVLIKQSVPMVPILLLGLAVSVFVGDLVWIVVKLL